MAFVSDKPIMAIVVTDPSSSPRPSSPPQSAGKKSALERRINKQNGKGETPLHVAAINGDVKQTKRLIKAGADVNLKDYAGTLTMAIICPIHKLGL